MSYPTPARVKRVDAFRTDVTWTDGHVSSYPSWYLREQCPCANCVEEFTGRRMVRKGSIPANLERANVEPVGRYALSFTWSDGHSTGIYTFDFLRRICPCPQCLPEGLQEPPETVPTPGSFQA